MNKTKQNSGHRPDLQFHYPLAYIISALRIALPLVFTGYDWIEETLKKNARVQLKNDKGQKIGYKQAFLNAGKNLQNSPKEEDKLKRPLKPE